MSSPAAVFLATALSLVASSSRAEAAQTTVSAADKAFVAKVSQGGMFEVSAGKLAATRGSTQDIRDLGTTEQHDHTLVGGKLLSIITPLALPHSPTLNAMFKAKIATLEALSGKAFDRAFVLTMDDIHNKDGAAFAQEAASGSNSDLRTFASETHRIVVRHLGALHAIDAGA